MLITANELMPQTVFLKLVELLGLYYLCSEQCVCVHCTGAQYLFSVHCVPVALTVVYSGCMHIISEV